MISLTNAAAEDDTCCICMTAFTKVSVKILTNCGHTCCQLCSFKLKSRHCFMCRRPLKNFSVANSSFSFKVSLSYRAYPLNISYNALTKQLDKNCDCIVCHRSGRNWAFFSPSSFGDVMENRMTKSEYRIYLETVIANFIEQPWRFCFYTNCDLESRVKSYNFQLIFDYFRSSHSLNNSDLANFKKFHRLLRSMYKIFSQSVTSSCCFSILSLHEFEKLLRRMFNRFSIDVCESRIKSHSFDSTFFWKLVNTRGILTWNKFVFLAVFIYLMPSFRNLSRSLFLRKWYRFLYGARNFKFDNE